MLVLQFDNLNNLNTSVQVGDEVYGVGTLNQFIGSDPQAVVLNTGESHRIGILRRIVESANGTQHFLFVDNSMLGASPIIPTPDTFIMFSKANQGDSGLVGYYARAKLVNNSVHKAELFSVGSEVIINSK